MLHTWECVKCNGEYTTSCLTFRTVGGKVVDAWEDPDYRRLRASDLCRACYAGLLINPDPVFELLFQLKEKNQELELIISALTTTYQDRLEKTPERLAKLVEEEKFRAECRTDWETKNGETK